MILAILLMVMASPTVRMDQESERVIVSYKGKVVQRLTIEDAIACGGQVAKEARLLRNSLDKPSERNRLSREEKQEWFESKKEELKTTKAQKSEDSEDKYISDPKNEESDKREDRRSEIRKLLGTADL